MLLNAVVTVANDLDNSLILLILAALKLESW